MDGWIFKMSKCFQKKYCIQLSSNTSSLTHSSAVSLCFLCSTPNLGIQHYLFQFYFLSFFTSPRSNGRLFFFLNRSCSYIPHGSTGLVLLSQRAFLGFLYERCPSNRILIQLQGRKLYFTWLLHRLLLLFFGGDGLISASALSLREISNVIVCLEITSWFHKSFISSKGEH